MKKATLLATLLVLASPATADVTRDLVSPTAPYANSVLIPPGATTLYLAGSTPAPINGKTGAEAVFGDTKAQTISALTRMKATLEKQGFALGDVVMMRVFLAADPAKGGVMDTVGMNEAYRQFFANPEQPKQPARLTVEVVRLAHPAWLVEIDAQAVKAP